MTDLTTAICCLVALAQGGEIEFESTIVPDKWLTRSLARDGENYIPAFTKHTYRVKQPTQSTD